MGRKHVNDDKDAGYGGRSVSGKGKGQSRSDNSNRDGRERNVGHTKGEEHSRVNKR